MIDWGNLAANALWILGCALALGTISYASFQASLNNEKLRTRLGRPTMQAAIDLAGVLFCAGLAATSRPVWQMALWALLGVLFLIQMVFSLRHKTTSAKEETSSEEHQHSPHRPLR
ncbi:MAG: hypothetical protein P8074_25855 [Anaerolineales bacterium]|jgi:hypothetical protein